MTMGQVTWRLIAAALSVAAAVAIVAIVSGDFGDGEWQVIATSTLFALATATGGAGAELTRRGPGPERALGAVVVAASAVAFVLVTIGIWTESDGDVLWRVAGVAGIVAVDGAHACLVLARRRGDDPQGARTATDGAVAAAAISGAMGIAAASGLADDAPWEPLAIVLILQLLATALAPILRRTGMRREEAPALSRDAAELRAIAEALERAPSAAEARALARRVRALADDA